MLKRAYLISSLLMISYFNSALSEESKFFGEIGVNYGAQDYTLKGPGAESSVKYKSLKAIGPSIKLGYRVNSRLSLIGGYERTAILSGKVSNGMNLYETSISTNGVTPENALGILQDTVGLLQSLPDRPFFTTASGTQITPNLVANAISGWYINNVETIDETLNELQSLGSINLSLNSVNDSGKVKGGGNSFEAGVKYQLNVPQKNEFFVFGGIKYSDFEVKPSNSTTTLSIASNVGINADIISFDTGSPFISKIKMIGMFVGGEYVRNHSSKSSAFINASLFIPIETKTQQKNWSVAGSYVNADWQTTSGFAYGLDLKGGISYKINDTFKTNIYVFYSLLDAFELKNSESDADLEIVSNKIGAGISLSIK